MTNTLDTPIEAMERGYPLHGRPTGSRNPAVVMVDTAGDSVPIGRWSRRRRSSRSTRPSSNRSGGGRGGKDGATGENPIDGEPVPSKTSIDVTVGTTVTVKTPGGGGHGDPSDREDSDRERDRRDETARLSRRLGLVVPSATTTAEPDPVDDTVGKRDSRCP